MAVSYLQVAGAEHLPDGGGVGGAVVVWRRRGGVEVGVLMEGVGADAAVDYGAVGGGGAAVAAAAAAGVTSSLHLRPQC